MDQNDLQHLKPFQFGFILLLPIFGVASEITIYFPNSTLLPSFVVMKCDYIDFDCLAQIHAGATVFSRTTLEHCKQLTV